MNAKNWFDVDRQGLSKLVERRGKLALILELVANALDADGTTRVEVLLEPEERVARATVVVRDDSSTGFVDLSHAWTIFAASSRKADPGKRGRFNLGEKLVLALCDEASIVSTKGGVLFSARGRGTMRSRLERGTEFQGIARVTRAELAEIEEGLRKIIAPAGVTVVVNGRPLPPRAPIATFEATLPTEVADAEGVLRRSARRTTVNVYEPLPGQPAMLHELGIPVVETGDRWDVSVEQKLLLNMDRDNVTPGYLRDVRTCVVNALYGQLGEDDASAELVSAALSDDRATPEAVNRALDLRFGERRAIWDPSDPEANNNLVAEGYALIKGGQLTKEQWQNAKRHDPRLKPSGQIKPTRKARFSPDGADRWVPRERWTPAMRDVVAYASDVCRELAGTPVEVAILSDVTQGWEACYGGQGLVLNLGRLGHDFFEACARGPTNRLNALLIHELGHGAPGGDNHLAATYHEGLCALGARLARLALERPQLFAW